ncbi:Hypothetical protein CINCED_3A003417 [Cinara cedri]|uniref:Crossover junction endonuclease EME1 n=1 Tax=Cinara cedri TaxID=506608 RepID=A0A5E4N0W4_9HEMI|nr:Hypothetical protein CINCED_3A003417 [Cinara cedri]
MNAGNYNTDTISDLDDSILIVEDHKINNDVLLNCPSSPDEPEFFKQVIQQQKRKKAFSSEITVHQGKDLFPTQNGVHINENKKMCVASEGDHESSTCKFNNQKSIPFFDNNILDPDVYIPVINEQTTEIIPRIEPIEPKRKKRLTKEESEEKKMEEKARKDAKKKLTEELKRLNPKECMKYITIHIDINLQNQDYCQQILSEIQSTDAKYIIESNSFVSHSITWSRQVSDNISEDEHFMLLIWDFDYVTNLIVSNQLIEQINNLKLYKPKLSIIIYSTAVQLKKTKSKKNSSSNILNNLQQMLLCCHVSFRFIENKNDIGLAILYFTKSIAQRPYKLNKYKEEQDGCDWYASGHTKNCITIDKNGTGLTQLWRQMLSQFPLCALETSEAIASVYSSPIALLQAYDNCSTRLEGETLLQDIPVRRGFGPLASNRRIGPELSKKIYIFFTDNTGCATLSQE